MLVECRRISAAPWLDGSRLVRNAAQPPSWAPTSLDKGPPGFARLVRLAPEVLPLSLLSVAIVTAESAESTGGGPPAPVGPERGPRSRAGATEGVARRGDDVERGRCGAFEYDEVAIEGDDDAAAAGCAATAATTATAAAGRPAGVGSDASEDATDPTPAGHACAKPPLPVEAALCAPKSAVLAAEEDVAMARRRSR